MRQRGGIVAFLLFLLSIIILLQVRAMIQTSQFQKGLDRFEQVLRDSPVTSGPRTSPAERTTCDEQPGDEGDWLVWAFRVEPRTLNQYSVEKDIYSRWITVPYICEPLLVYNYDTLEMEPWLAERYEISDDGLEITFYLRDDIYFSDGVPVTADDVLFTYQTAIDPRIDAADVASLFVEVAGAERLSSRVIKFRMKRPYFKALEIVSFWDFGILPKHVYEYDDPKEFNSRVSDPVGSGPFLFEKWQTGRQVVLRRNENYWGPKPKLRKIVYKFITNATAAIQALRSHKVDIVIPEPDQFAELADDKQFNKEFMCLSYWNPGVPFYYIGWNQNRVFFSDKRVRRAMTLIVDRERIVSELLKGHGRVTSGPFFIEGNGNDPNIKPWPYDPARAEQLLTEAGWIDSDGDGVRDKDGVPFRFEFMYSADSALYRRLAKFIKDEAARVGIEVVPAPFEWSVVISRVIDRDFDAMVMGWGGDVLEDFYQIFHSSQIANRGSNYVGFENPQADAILEQIRRTFDKAERDHLCHRFHRILHEEQPYTFLFTRPTFRLVDRRFRNVKIYKLGPKYWQWYVPRELQRYK